MKDDKMAMNLNIWTEMGLKLEEQRGMMGGGGGSRLLKWGGRQANTDGKTTAMPKLDDDLDDLIRETLEFSLQFIKISRESLNEDDTFGDTILSILQYCSHARDKGCFWQWASQRIKMFPMWSQPRSKIGIESNFAIGQHLQSLTLQFSWLTDTFMAQIGYEERIWIRILIADTKSFCIFLFDEVKFQCWVEL